MAPGIEWPLRGGRGGRCPARRSRLRRAREPPVVNIKDNNQFLRRAKNRPVKIHKTYLHCGPCWRACLPIGHSERGHGRVAEKKLKDSANVSPSRGG